jgi:agmatinase
MVVATGPEGSLTEHRPGATPVGPIDGTEVPRFAGLRTFARLPRDVDVDAVQVAVLGVPYDGGATFRSGARFGPSAIREASLLLRAYDPVTQVAPFAQAQIADAGDAPINPLDIAAAHRAIEASATELHRTGASVLGLGGDHSVSLPLLRAAAARFGPLALIQFDAHSDTWDSYFDEKVTHGTIFRRAIEEQLIDPRASIQIGLRGSLYGPDDLAENAALGFEVVDRDRFDELGAPAVIDLIGRVVTKPAYITLDIDVLDPAFAPGTGTPEIGGLTTRELSALLAGIANRTDVSVVSADVVEVAPAYDPAGVTALAAANLAYHLIGMLGRPGRAGVDER